MISYLKMFEKQATNFVQVLGFVILAAGVLGQTPLERLKDMRKSIQHMEEHLKSIHQLTESRDTFIQTFEDFDKKWDQRIRLFKEALFFESGEHQRKRYALDKIKRVSPQGINVEIRCLLIGGYLAESTSNNNHNFMKSFLSTLLFNKYDYVYIGGNNYDDIDTWVNPVSNTLVIGTWARGYPSGAEAENCLSLDKSRSFDLDNTFCNDKQSRSLCEIPIHS